LSTSFCVDVFVSVLLPVGEAFSSSSSSSAEQCEDERTGGGGRRIQCNRERRQPRGFEDEEDEAWSASVHSPTERVRRPKFARKIRTVTLETRVGFDSNRKFTPGNEKGEITNPSDGSDGFIVHFERRKRREETIAAQSRRSVFVGVYVQRERETVFETVDDDDEFFCEFERGRGVDELVFVVVDAI
jgi:hypothetical protein